MIQFGAMLTQDLESYVVSTGEGVAWIFCASGVANFLGCSLMDLPPRIIVTLSQGPFLGAVLVAEDSKAAVYRKLFMVSAPMTHFGKMLLGINNHLYDPYRFEESQVGKAMTGSLYWSVDNWRNNV